MKKNVSPNIVGKTNTGKSLAGQDIEAIMGISIINSESFESVDGVTTMTYPKANKILFFDALNESIIDFLKNSYDSCLHILPETPPQGITVPYIAVKTPRIALSKLMTIIFEYTNGYYNGYLGADEVTNRFPDTMIMPGCNIHRSVTMGRNCFIHPNVVIGPNCIIGDNVTIRSNTVIGQPGFGIIAQDNLEHIHLPHVGGVWIGHDVEIGALTSVVSGTIHPTIIEPHVKIDDLVHVAHNCYFAKGAQIIAQAQVSGSVYLGEGVWIGPNACVIDRISIGDKTLVGIGSTVIKPLPENVKAVGSPARIL